AAVGEVEGLAAPRDSAGAAGVVRDECVQVLCRLQGHWPRSGAGQGEFQPPGRGAGVFQDPDPAPGMPHDAGAVGAGATDVPLLGALVGELARFALARVLPQPQVRLFIGAAWQPGGAVGGEPEGVTQPEGALQAGPLLRQQLLPVALAVAVQPELGRRAAPVALPLGRGTN